MLADALTPTTNPLQAIFSQAQPNDETERQILRHALAALVQYGPRRMSMEDVARRADLSRITLYRRFTDKEALIVAVIISECRRCLLEIVARIGKIKSVEERFVQGFAATVDVARQHPIFARVASDGLDSDWLTSLPVSATEAIDFGRGAMTGIIRGLQAQGHLARVDAEDLAETLIRLWQSIVFVRSDRLSADNPASVEAYARGFLFPLLSARSKRGGAKP